MDELSRFAPIPKYKYNFLDYGRDILSFIESSAHEVRSAYIMYHDLDYQLRTLIQQYMLNQESLDRSRGVIWEKSRFWTSAMLHMTIGAIRTLHDILIAAREYSEVGLHRQNALNLIAWIEKEYPKITQLRHTVAHRFEISLDTKKNAFMGKSLNKGGVHLNESGRAMLFENKDGHIYYWSRKGEILSFSMEEKVGKSMIGTVARILSAT